MENGFKLAYRTIERYPDIRSMPNFELDAADARPSNARKFDNLGDGEDVLRVLTFEKLWTVIYAIAVIVLQLSCSLKTVHRFLTSFNSFE